MVQVFFRPQLRGDRRGFHISLLHGEAMRNQWFGCETSRLEGNLSRGRRVLGHGLGALFGCSFHPSAAATVYGSSAGSLVRHACSLQGRLLWPQEAEAEALRSRAAVALLSWSLRTHIPPLRIPLQQEPGIGFQGVSGATKQPSASCAAPSTEGFGCVIRVLTVPFVLYANSRENSKA